MAFDLDDTLYQEMEYVHSAYRAIAAKFGARYLSVMMSAPTPSEAFDATGLDVGAELDIYRNHFPDITLPWDSLYTLALLKNKGHILALITDGRVSTQCNKIAALGLERFISHEMIYVSGNFGESKITGGAMRDIMRKCPGEKCLYVGDNPEKDFIRGNELGWITVALKAKTDNVHPQNFESVAPNYRPVAIIRDIVELIEIVNRLDCKIK